MTLAALGTKRKCLSCGGRFFDLLHDPIVCPKCAEVFTPPPPLPHRQQYRSRIPEIVAAAVIEPEAVAESDESEDEVETSEEDSAAADPDVLDPDLDSDDAA